MAPEVQVQRTKKVIEDGVDEAHVDVDEAYVNEVQNWPPRFMLRIDALGMVDDKMRYDDPRMELRSLDVLVRYPWMCKEFLPQKMEK